MPTAATPCDRPAFLADAKLQLLLFAGKGGVGKTTCAAAAALTLANDRPHDAFLLVSVDPAHSLSDALAGEPPPQNLEVVELDAAACLAEFIGRHRATLREIARRGTFLDEEDVQRFVDLTLPGMDELLAFLRIAEWTESRRYRTVIVDTAPSGHTHRLLTVPELVGGFVAALDALLAKHRYLVEHYRGTYQPDQTDALLGELAAAASRTQRLWESEHSNLIPVLVAEPLSVAETQRFLAQLTAQRVRIGPLLVNRLRPHSSCPQCLLQKQLQEKTLRQQLPALSHKELWGLPLFPDEVRGTTALAALFDHAVPLTVPPHLGGSASAASPAPRVGGGQAAPTQRLLLFAGKGGVGKTTLACATALRLAADGRSVTLLSTDPAHSLADCVGVAIGTEPVALKPGLWAVAPDAEAQWRDWQAEYQDEVEQLWQERLAHAQLAFERQALDRLLALSPPGLDELVALTQVTALLSQAPATTLVIDTAPTGHLLRLLALPEVMESWLRAIFAVLLKNRQAVRMPRLSDRLIELSRRLKTLRTLLREPRQTAVFAVAIPTWMAYEETRDLLGSCRGLGIAVAQLFINQVTPVPADSCHLCTRLAGREQAVVTALTTEVAPLPVSTIAAQAPPLGLAALAQLGQALYPKS